MFMERHHLFQLEDELLVEGEERRNVVPPLAEKGAHQRHGQGRERVGAGGA